MILHIYSYSFIFIFHLKLIDFKHQGPPTALVAVDGGGDGVVANGGNGDPGVVITDVPHPVPHTSSTYIHTNEKTLQFEFQRNDNYSRSC